MPGEQIETEALTISSKLLPLSASDPAASLTSKAKAYLTLQRPKASQPTVLLTLKYIHSANGGKSVLSEKEGVLSLHFTEVFDSAGTLVKPKLEALLSGLEQVRSILSCVECANILSGCGFEVVSRGLCSRLATLGFRLTRNTVFVLVKSSISLSCMTIG